MWSLLLDLMLRRAGTVPMTSTERLTTTRRHLSLGAEQDLLVRLAGDGDRESLRRLAALDSTLAPTGEVLVAELDGVAVAALSLTIIAIALMCSPAAREWAMENKQLAAPVIFGLLVVGLIPAFVAAIGQ